MSDAGQPSAARPRLKCLFGAEAPPDVNVDIQRILLLPEAAKQRFWEALGPSLGEPVPAEVEALLDAFCGRYQADGGDLARALKACRFLVREASRADLDAGAFAEDLAAVSGGSEEIARILLAGYGAARSRIQREALTAALVAHGKLLVGVDWRVDTITAAGGARMKEPVTLLTLRYREGDKEDRITLQVVPGALRELQRICAQILG